MPTPDTRPTPNSWLTTLGWASYLACSWTWCIGMFLPVLLIRDFGLWGFIVFAVPNVLGAAAMGWVVRAPGASESLVQKHRSACRWFSLVTAFFQFYFCWWLLLMSTQTSDPMTSAKRGVAIFAIFFIGIILSCLSMDPDNSLERRRVRKRQVPLRAFNLMWAPIALWLWSMALAAGVAAFGELRLPDAAGPLGQPPPSILALAPVCAFGFLLCPILDLTLHHGRQRALGRSGNTAFTLGFGVLFLTMILFTLGYAHLFLSRPVGGPSLAGSSIVSGLVFLHILVQAFFTAKIHMIQVLDLSNLRTDKPAVSARSLVRLAIVTLVFTVAGLFILGAGTDTVFRSYRGLSPGEITYRLFMSFYGLAFPAYVWLCMIPTRNEPTTQPPSRTKLTILFTAIALAAPFYWMGFIERQTWYLAPGLAVVLLARLVLPRSTLAPSRQ